LFEIVSGPRRAKGDGVSEVSVEDRVLIRELYSRFYMALNEGDAETQKACFAPGGTIRVYSGDEVTPEFSAATGAKWSQDPVGKTYQHHVTNLIVDPDPEGREDYRSARMYFFVTGVWEPPNIIVRWSCKANDTFQRVDGEWLFSRREITLNHDSTGPHWSNEPTHPDKAEV
jgi:hypothetical protein